MSLCVAPSLTSSVRSDVFFRRSRASGEKTLRQSVNVRRKSRFAVPAGVGRRSYVAVRADATSELEDGQIEGVRPPHDYIDAIIVQKHTP